jgi:hypothetical protein
MHLLIDPIHQRFQPAFHTHALTQKEMDSLCDGIEMLEGIFASSHPTTYQQISTFILKFLQPVASLLARVNVEGNLAVAALRLFERISRGEDWGGGEKKRLEVAVGELLANYKRWNDGQIPQPPSNLFQAFETNGRYEGRD